MIWEDFKKNRAEDALKGVVCAIASVKNNVLVYGEYKDVIMLLKQFEKVSGRLMTDTKARRLFDILQKDNTGGIACIYDGKNIECVVDCKKYEMVNHINQIINKLAVREGRKQILKDLKEGSEQQ